MAKWELAKSITLGSDRMMEQGTPAVGSHETVAETVDEKGQVIGRWVVEWTEGGEGTCHEAGSVIRCVHTPHRIRGSELICQTFQRSRRASHLAIYLLSALHYLSETKLTGSFRRCNPHTGEEFVMTQASRTTMPSYCPIVKAY
jgi:hypothetical protein